MVSIPRFDVYKPSSLEDALEYLDREAPEAIPMSGGTELLVLIRDGIIKPKKILDLWPLRSTLSYVKRENGYIKIGALTTIEELIHSFLAKDRRYLGFLDLYKNFATHQIRTMATVGGNIGCAHPMSDAVTLLLTLNAEVKFISVKGERWARLEDVFAGKRILKKDPNEIIAEVRFKELPDNSSTALMKFDRRKAHAMGYIVTAASMTLDNNKISRIAIAFDSMGKPYPGRAKKTEEALRGKEFNLELISETVNEVLPKEMVRISDYRATAEYRLHLSKVLLKRVLQRIKERIG